jgi:threonine/homoserine/homoserine lactone efflux protein
VTLYSWLTFVAASAAMGIIPGPGVTSIVAYALGSGRRVALASVAGMAVGNGLAMTLSFAGVGALLAASARAFSVVKWLGAAYLIGLGVWTIIRSRETHSRAMPEQPLSARSAFLGNVAIGTFHPKTIVFFVAFVPQFVSAGKSYAAQASLLIITFCCVVAATDSAYAIGASKAARMLKGPSVERWSARASGGILVVAGVATAAK